MRTLYIECNMGAAGDMLMGALYELLEDKEGFLKTMNSLGLPGVHVEAEAGKTCGIAGTHMRVTVHGEEETTCGHDHGHEHDHVHSHEDSHTHEHIHSHDHSHPQEHNHEHSHEHHRHHHHATPGHIRELIDTLCLPEEVKKEARAVYDRIARAEARAHGCPVGDVHFHEVGALDAVADVTGVCYCLYLLKPERIVVSPVHVGSGTVRCAHGIMPVPAPATANLLEGAPSYGGEIRGELCTPTGAALLTQFADAFGSMPVMTGAGVGIGIGTKEFPQANCVRVFLGESRESEAAGMEAGETGVNGRITELICNLDDMTPEALSYACGRLLEAGALDVYTLPGTMKKGRPGHVLTVLCEEGNEEEMVRKIFRETATNGVRARRCEKYFLKPGVEKVSMPWGEVRIKTASGYGVTHKKPEYEDVAKIAREQNLPWGKVRDEVIRRTDIDGQEEK
ncbi:nickel pincer cofactor biosynthesis protein LarC [uncultured Merdimonas sp.]|uniref:nickel pincer cofactor biosynthesis protein LarC n=1 Tax=uncultured Merdimonas sp. TaxID=2023269 RepID=UPI00320A04D4